MENKNKLTLTREPFCKLPNKMNESEPIKLSPKDQYIYLCIKYYDGKEGCYPSLKAIAQKAGVTEKTVRKSIKNLEQNGYLRIDRSNARTFYKFLNENLCKGFEMIAKKFIDNQNLNLTFSQKAYLVAIQQYLVKYSDGDVGNISWTDKEIADILNVDRSTISALHRELIKKEYVKVSIKSREAYEFGRCKAIKTFMNFFYGINAKLVDHEARIGNVENNMCNMQDEIDKLKQEICELNNKIDIKNNEIENKNREIYGLKTENKKLEDAYIADQKKKIEALQEKTAITL